MGSFLCLALGVVGKTSPFCPCPSRCLSIKAGKWMYKNLTSYESACQEDPDLKSFDYSVDHRTRKLLTSLDSPAGKNESLDSLTQVCGYLKDISEDVVNIIIGNNDDMWKNEEVKSVVDLYFEGTSKTLKFFSSVENGVKETDRILHKLRIALKKYETESAFGGSMPKKYAETLEKLTKVTNMGDPFGDDFSKQYESLLKEHVTNLEKISELQVKLEKKHKNVKNWRGVAHAVFLTTLLSFFALSVVSLAVAAPAPFVGIVIKITAASYGPAGLWLNRMMSYAEALEKQNQSLGSTMTRTKVDVQSMKTIKSLVEKLQSQIKSIFRNVEDAGENREEKEAMELVMQKMIKEVDEFAVQIDIVGEKVASYIDSVIEGKDCVMKRMARSVF